MDIDFVKTKLITKEDSMHFHKILGILCLGSFIYRWSCFAIYREMFFQNTFGLASLLAHMLLSGSSLIFHIPRKRHQGKPMIYPEYRAHSIVFTIRNLLSCILFWFEYDQRWIRYILCLANMVVADTISSKYTETASQTTMRNMPMDGIISEAAQQRNKFQQSKSQIYATIMCIGSLDGSFMPVMAIQIAAFLMTLVRKNIISTLTWHRIYNISLWICIGWVFRADLHPSELAAIMISSQLYTKLFFKWRTNKYMNWMVVFCIHEISAMVFGGQWSEVAMDRMWWLSAVVVLKYIYGVVRDTRDIMWWGGGCSGSSGSSGSSGCSAIY
jgi:hypothetical protein